jgi:carbon monoxide dehydrogenase subunit G
MKIGGEYTFDGPRDLVWAMLLDPLVLARVLPGAESLEQVGENEYAGALKMKVGPVQGDFQGKVRLENIDAPNGYTMQVDGRGAAGFVKATGHLALTAEGERTRLVYDGDAQVGGKLAAVGQRLVESSTRAIIAQSLEGLNAAVKARVASRAHAAASPGATPPPDGPAFEKPSQSEFAAGVAKQLVRELIPPGVLKVIIAILILLALLILYRIAT